MEKLEKIFSNLAILICIVASIALLIHGIYTNNVKQIVGASIGTIMCLILIVMYIYVTVGDSISTRKEKKYEVKF